MPFLFEVHMTIKENVTVYSCDFCKRKMFRKHAMINHEQYCGSNPKNWRACSACDFMVRKPIEYYFDAYDGEHEGTSKGFYCEHLETYMYPNFLENKRVFIEHPEQFEEQIPFKKQCVHFTELGCHKGLSYNPEDYA
jgi:hypothetical protein